VFASGALHELNRFQKQDVLRRLAARVRFLILIEFAANHDEPAVISNALAWRAARFYNGLIGDALKSLPGSVHEAVIGVFLLGEVLDIWLNDYDHRRNYHLPLPGWLDFLLAAGFQVVATDKFEAAGLTTCYILGDSRVDPAG
jgi:hypothetical protein